MPNGSRLVLLFSLLAGLAAWLTAETDGSAAYDEGNPQKSELFTESPSPRVTPVALRLDIGLGLDSETGRRLAVEPVLGLGLRAGPFFMDGVLAAATGEALLDRAVFRYGWFFRPSFWLRGSGQNLVAWRSYGSDGDETRLGVIVSVDWGAQASRMGFALRTIVGYSILKTRIPALDLAWVDQDPILGLGLVWFSGTGWEVSTRVSDFDQAEATLWMKTLFGFAVAYQCPDWRVQLDLVVKYSDWFTLTAYVDGLALRLSAALPLTGGLE